MKPSEFITKFKVYKEQNNIILKPVTFEDLDLRFIDREELKEKINKLNYSLDVRGEMPYKRKCYLEEILKLLE